MAIGNLHSEADLRAFIQQELDRSSLSVLVRQGQSSLSSGPWIAPTLLNSWVNFGGAFAAAGYYRDPLGIVRLKGLVNGGVAGSIIFNLPVGYRPAAQHIFAVIANNAIGRVDVRTGDVFFDTGSSAFVSLSGISFRAEA